MAILASPLDMKLAPMKQFWRKYSDGGFGSLARMAAPVGPW